MHLRFFAIIVLYTNVMYIKMGNKITNVFIVKYGMKDLRGPKRIELIVYLLVYQKIPLQFIKNMRVFSLLTVTVRPL